MDNDTIKIQRDELKRNMSAAGFVISSAAEESIDLLLERTTEQAIEVGTEIVRKGHYLPGFLAVTQDHLIFSKRLKRGILGSYPDEFFVIDKPLGARSIHGTANVHVMADNIEISFARATNTPYGSPVDGFFFKNKFQQNLHAIAQFCVNGKHPNGP